MRVTVRPTQASQDPSISKYAGNIVFEFSDIWTPEGTLRIRLWRGLDVSEGILTSAARLGENTAAIPTVTVPCKRAVLTKLPTVSFKTERYFTEANIDAFDLEIYDAPDAAFIGTPVLSGPVRNQRSVSITLAEAVEARLFVKYIKPKELSEVYCSVEFFSETDTGYRTLVIGKIQNAISGVDHQWRHEQPNNPYLGEGNMATDAERTWSLKFVPVTLAGLGLTPARPTTGPSDPVITDSWTMPFYNAASPDSALPYDAYPRNTPNEVIQLSSFDLTTYPYTRWRRHISFYKAFASACDYAFGAGNWTASSDQSPFEFEVPRIATYNFATQWSDFAALWQRPRFSDDAAPSERVLIPQCVFSAHDSLATNPNQPAPIIMGAWPRRYKTAWDWITEFAYCCGFRPMLRLDTSGPTPVAHIRFKRIDTPDEDTFTTIVPTEATPTRFAESENGIKVALASQPLNARDEAGLQDDWLAGHNTSVSGGIETSNEWGNRISVRQAQPYTVPSTATKAAEMTTSLTFAGPLGTIQHKTTPSTTEYVYSLYNNKNANNTYTEAFPTLGILMMGDESIVPLPAVNPADLPNMYHVYDPVVRGRFVHNGITVTGDSWRQLLARFYALEYVRSPIKYEVTYHTINKFTSPKTGSTGWWNIECWRQTQLFEPDDQKYYVKAFTFDFESMTTRVELLQSAVTNEYFESADGTSLDFKDDTERTGGTTTTQITGGPVASLTTSGSTSPYVGTTLLDTSLGNITLTMLDATTMPGVAQTFVNTGSGVVTVSFIVGQGTGLSIPAYSTYVALSNGTAWVTVANNTQGDEWVKAPATSTSPGTAGQRAYDGAGNLYYCYGANKWGKVAGTLSF